MNGAIGIWLFFVFALGFFFHYLLRNLFSMLFNIPLVRRRVFNREAMERFAGYLDDFPYYRQLSPEGKNKFMERLVTFMINKEFSGENELKVTEEMKVRVSAAAVQLTFGLKHYLLPRTERIYLYPDEFSHYRLRRKALGLVTWNNDLHLSWKHFQKGFADPADRVNLGLHEMAHALKLQAMTREGVDEELRREMRRWLTTGQKLYARLKKYHSKIMRAKAGDTLDEFFAISAEHFFEAPSDLRQQLPEYYKFLCRLFRQDPLNIEYDYLHLEGAQRAPERRAAPLGGIRLYGWHWSHSAIVVGLFPGSFLVYWLGLHTAIDTQEIFLGIFVLAGLNVVSRPYFGAREILSGGLFALYSLFGVGVCGTAVLLALNFLVPVGPLETETYAVEGQSGNMIRTFSLEKNTYGKAPLLRSFWDETLPKGAGRSNYLQLEMRRGLLGFKTLRDYKFLP